MLASDDTPQPLSPRGEGAPRLVVGLGASAGGLDAFKSFLGAMPPQNGMAFVLIQHLDPDHDSLLVELLGKHTEMPISAAEDGMAVVANQVFVIPPNAVLTIESGILRVTRPAPPREHRKPIDMFFASLAEDQNENCVCVILSGSGSDGSLGLRVVKEHGGFVLAQAGFDETALLGMPRSATATGLVDEVLPVEQMPARLIAYQQHLNRVGDRKAPDGTRSDAAEHLTKICVLLRARLGHDFSEYKEKTLVRRIQRRMQVLQIDGVPEYIDRLREDPDQLDRLFREFLIGVTQFFRDPDAFAALENEVIPKLLDNRKRDDAIRIWVPGCATGEEAYSIAILVKEAMTKREIAPKVQIFATDLDEHAVAVARRGRYRNPLSGVSPRRLERWFAEEGDDYCMVKEIREMCVYSVHNLAKDPPFSKLDLISCRNVFIYFDVPLQHRLVQTFHYALKSNGCLFLGTSESLTRHGGLFTVLDNKHRLFQRRDDVATALPSGLLGSAPAQSNPAAAQLARVNGDGLDRRAREVLEKHSPAYVVINRQHEVLRFSGRTGQYIEHSQGAASLNLFGIVRKDLLPAVRDTVREAITARRQVVHADLVIAVDGHSKIVNLIVEPMSVEADEEFYVVAFQDRGSALPESGPAPPLGHGHQPLEKELRAARAQLESTIGDLETANEELKSANEEYQSINEEFQSSNEELESSKEELQSMNEELHTLNGELNSKNEALAEVNSDVKNLLDSTQIATIFLDNDLRIRNFTPTISEIFNLRGADIGRPITDIAARLSYTDLASDAKKVLRSLSMIEREVAAQPAGAAFLMRIRPYRTVDNVIRGVVITFVDITEGRRAEKVVRDSEDRYRTLFDLGPVAVYSCDTSGVIDNFNRRAAELWGREPAVGDTDQRFCGSFRLFHPDGRLMPHDQTPMAEVVSGRISEAHDAEVLIERPDGSRITVIVNIRPLKNDDGEITGAINCFYDITERKRSEVRQHLLMEELNHRVKNTLATVQSIAAQSLKGASDAESRETFDARLVALSRTHDLLAHDNWESVSLGDLLIQELEPYRSEEETRFVIDGPDFELLPKPALALGMAFHELATNAAKYGALSNSTGQVRVTWDFLRSPEQGVLRLKWAESGGPPVKKRERTGFGSILIERGLSLELDGEVRLDFAPAGLVCAMEIPLQPPPD